MKGYTIQHSINLLENSVEDLEARPSGGGSAADVSYDNTSSGLTADDVQDAIDELNTAIGQIDTGDNYSESETAIGKWIDGSVIYRKVVDMGTLPNNTTVSVAHNISDLAQFVSVRGVGVASTHAAIPLPFVDDSNKNGDVLLDVNSTNVRIIAKSDKSTYTGYVILEYIKTPAQTNSRSKKTKKEE